MTKRPTLILDCDGVLYPTSMLELKDFVSAMQKTFEQDYHFDEAFLKQVSEKTLRKNHLGMFNYIKAVCDEKDKSFQEFCRLMFSKVNYDQITEDRTLLNMLKARAAKDEVVIFTNNTIGHLDKVLNRRFGASVFEFENLGIECYDIMATERQGVFYPKQNPKALELFASKINRLPQDCVLVDDSPRNIESAKQAGMQAVLIHKNFDLKALLKNLDNQANFQTQSPEKSKL